jgi:hypothetical protein
MKTPQQIKNEVEKEFKRKVYLLERKSYLSQKINSEIALSDEERKEFVLTPSSNIIQGEMKELKAKLSILTEYDKSIKEMIDNFRTKLRQCDEFFNVNDYKNTQSTDKFMGIVELFLKQELLSKIGDNSEVEK